MKSIVLITALIINVVPSIGLVFIRMGNTPEGSIDITPIFIKK